MTATPTSPRSTPASKPLALALASAAWLLPAVLSFSTAPSPHHPRIWLWYQGLRQPRWKPPDAAVPLAWIAIESCLALATYRLVRTHASKQRNSSLAWLATNIISIGGWSRLFFGKRSLPVSTVAAAGLLASSVGFVASARKTDSTAAAAGVPMVAWVAFATVLTAALWRRNR